MTKSTSGRSDTRMYGVLTVQTGSGIGWTSCSTAGTRTTPCQAAAAVTLMWCWSPYHPLDGDSRKASMLPHSETRAAVRRAEYHWTDGSSLGTVAQCSIYNTIRAANNVSGAFPQVSETKGPSLRQTKPRGSLSVTSVATEWDSSYVWYNGLCSDICKKISVDFQNTSDHSITYTLTHHTVQYLDLLLYVDL